MNRCSGVSGIAATGKRLLRSSCGKAWHESCRAFFSGSLLALGACAPPDTTGQPEPGEAKASRPVVELVGRLQNGDIDEASGIARSQRRDDLFWVVNDSGKSRVHAIDSRGRMLGRVKVEKASNSDWEDIASFDFDGKSYLLVADIGDNDGKRKDVRLYFIEEPDPGEKEVDVAWRYDFDYDGKPRDAEAIAVDVKRARVLVLSKRELPPALYELPLKPDSKKRQTARRLGPVMTLPKPRRRDVEFAPATNNYWWQPTAMDISRDGSSAVILTYSGVFHYQRADGEDWLDAFGRVPAVLSVADYGEAEAVAFNGDGTAVYVTFEGRRAPLLRIGLEEAATE